jgi:cation diffusion facilitator CzcD-associated flavoprotein CzcO
VYRAVEIASITSFMLGMAALVWRLAPPVAQYPWLGVGAAVAGYFAADLACGFFHWGADTWGDTDTPLVGNALIRPFREHHVAPKAMVAHDFVETNGTNCLMSLPGFAVPLFLPLGEGATLGLFVAAAWTSMLAWVMATNQIHKWAHTDEPPRFVALLQRSGIVLSPEHHAHHHTPPFDRYYSITSGWTNWIVAQLGIYRGLERIISGTLGWRVRAGSPHDAAPSTGASPDGRLGAAEELDVLVIGAGLSGIAAGYHLQRECPNHSFAIVEARGRLGGTWDLFRYPGVRSDSDMHTLGYAFRPWPGDRIYAGGADILAYLEDTAREFGIDRRIRYHQRVVRSSWSSERGRWSVEVVDTQTGLTRRVLAKFVICCSGYYDYDNGHAPVFAGAERFAGRIIHPQHWPEGIELAGKRVVVIGSGATAMTLVPAIAEQAAHVTMLQRSPTYVVALPGVDPLARVLNRLLPSRLAYAIVRWKNIAVGAVAYKTLRAFPRRTAGLIIAAVRRNLGRDFDVSTHFTPQYNPWDQRPCFVPDGDLFQALKAGRAEVVTDQVSTFTETGIELASGKCLEADLIVTATGLQIQLFGGALLEVDGRIIEPGRTTVYKGSMLGGVPNFAVVVGYTNASWTLKADLVCEYVCRVLRHMEVQRYDRVMPEASSELPGSPIINSTAGYVQRALSLLPKQGPSTPWRLHQNYFLDLVALRLGKLEDGVLEFTRAASRPQQPVAEPAPEPVVAPLDHGAVHAGVLASARPSARPSERPPRLDAAAR